MSIEVDYAVLGAGAMGAIIGAHLARAGHSVAMLARGRRAAQIQSDGLRIRGLIDLTVPVRTVTDPATLKRAETLIVTTKAIGTAAALEPLRHVRIGAALSVQNGVMKDDLLAQAFGVGNALGALANTSGELLPSGEVLFTRNKNLLIGELSGQLSERASRVASALDSSGVRSTAVPDILDHEWTKFAGWVGFMGLAVTTRSSTWKYLTDPGAALVVARLIREIGALARADGAGLTDESMTPVATICRGTEQEAAELLMSLGADFKATAPDHRLSTLQDLEAGRPLELEETVGFAVEKARRLNVPLPLVSSFYELTSAIDRINRLRSG